MFTGEGLRDPEPELKQVESGLNLRDGKGEVAVPELSVTILKAPQVRRITSRSLHARGRATRAALEIQGDVM